MGRHGHVTHGWVDRAAGGRAAGGRARLVGRRLPLLVGVVVGLTGLIGAGLAGQAFAESEAALAAHRMPLVPGTPCTVTAKSCVDLESQRAWLFQDGKVLRGPVRVSSGGKGKETPIGHSLRVYRKERDHLSQESRQPNGQPAKMPWSVFFADGGIAFHGGDPNRASAGCIHLSPKDAQAWFNYLEVGDQVQVVRAAEERAARAALANGTTTDADSSDASEPGDD
jgi:L,D-transpeptidase catalytic domain